MHNNKNLKISKKPHILIIKQIESDNKLRKLTSTKKLSPLSGAEPQYNPDLWNKNNNIKGSHNCYTYALGKIIPGLTSKAQPGYASGFNHVNNDFSCEEFSERLKNDSPGSYLEDFDNKCLPGFYKIFLALDPGNDYHWWQQNDNKLWSHKPGSTNVINLDGSGNLIQNPLLSNRNFKHRNYQKSCFFACVYSDLTRSLDHIYSKGTQH
jgi:hypothetical protein